ARAGDLPEGRIGREREDRRESPRAGATPVTAPVAELAAFVAVVVAVAALGGVAAVAFALRRRAGGAAPDGMEDHLASAERRIGDDLERTRQSLGTSLADLRAQLARELGDHRAATVSGIAEACAAQAVSFTRLEDRIEERLEKIRGESGASLERIRET